MPYQQGWYIHKRIIVAYMWGTMTVDELQAMWSEGAAMLDAGIAPVHVIAFDSDIEHAPRNLQILRDMTSKIGHHPSVGWVINIGYQNPFSNLVSGMLAKVFRIPYYRCGTFDEALDYLRTNDTTLNWQDANINLLDDLTARQ